MPLISQYIRNSFMMLDKALRLQTNEIHSLQAWKIMNDFINHILAKSRFFRQMCIQIKNFI